MLDCLDIWLRSRNNNVQGSGGIKLLTMLIQELSELAAETIAPNS